MKTPWIAATLLATCCALTFGQSSNGMVRISGRVVDPIGGELTSASVTLKASNSGETIATTTSSQDGAFTFAAVLPGTYKLSVISSGFSQYILAVDANSGKDVAIGTVVLEVGRLGGNPLDLRDLLESLSPTPTDPTVCEILKEPAPFHGRIVRVRAPASGAGIDTGPNVFDSDCQGMIFLNFPTSGSVLDDPTYRTLQSSLRSKSSVLATIEGRLEYQLMISEQNMMYLNVAKVSDVVPITGRR